jgi:hypothetical protein
MSDRVPGDPIRPGRILMDEADIPLFQTPDEQRRIGLDLTRRLLATIEGWGKSQDRKSVQQMREVTLDALLRTVTMICVYRELSGLGTRPEELQATFQRVNKEGPIEAEESDSVLALRARRDVLLRNMERAVRAF